MDVILLPLEIVGCLEEKHKESEGIQAFTPDSITKQGLRYHSPTQSESTGLLNFTHHSTLADYMKPNERLTMFLPEENMTTWGLACVAEDTEICTADGTFSLLQNSVGKEIWTNQQGKRKVGRIHKLDVVPKQTLLCSELGLTG